MGFIKSMFTGRDNQTWDMICVLAVVVAVTGLALEIYAVVTQKQPSHLARWLLIISDGLKNLSGIGRGPLLGVSRPRLLCENACWKSPASIPVKVFRADAGPMSHSKKCLPVVRRGIGAAPVLGTADQFYPPRMLKSRLVPCSGYPLCVLSAAPYPHSHTLHGRLGCSNKRPFDGPARRGPRGQHRRGRLAVVGQSAPKMSFRTRRVCHCDRPSICETLPIIPLSVLLLPYWCFRIVSNTCRQPSEKTEN